MVKTLHEPGKVDSIKKTVFRISKQTVSIIHRVYAEWIKLHLEGKSNNYMHNMNILYSLKERGIMIWNTRIIVFCAKAYIMWPFGPLSILIFIHGIKPAHFIYHPFQSDGCRVINCRTFIAYSTQPRCSKMNALKIT